VSKIVKKFSKVILKVGVKTVRVSTVGHYIAIFRYLENKQDMNLGLVIFTCSDS